MLYSPPVGGGVRGGLFWSRGGVGGDYFWHGKFRDSPPVGGAVSRTLPPSRGGVGGECFRRLPPFQELALYITNLVYFGTKPFLRAFIQAKHIPSVFLIFRVVATIQLPKSPRNPAKFRRFSRQNPPKHRKYIEKIEILMDYFSSG